MVTLSLLQQIRLQYHPKLPKKLESVALLQMVSKTPQASSEAIKKLFPKIAKNPFLGFEKQAEQIHQAKLVGVVLSGGQAPGGHNVISGLYDALKKLNPDSRLFGFCQGPKGIIENQYVEITEELLSSYRNQGGFDLIGSGRTKIETPEQFNAAEETVRKHDLDGLVIVGGDDSNTNAALLAEYFLDHDVKTCVIGVPKTIDGDLKNEHIEVSFGFDTASKTYAETIGNIMKDALSAQKYYYFIKLMGRTASHLTVECALQTHPNLVIVSEEIEADAKTLLQVTQEICDLIQQRAEEGKDFGVILIPEGVVEFIPECKQLIKELNALLADGAPHGAHLDEIADNKEKSAYVSKHLTDQSKQCFQSLPEEIQAQLLIGRDPHGNVQVSKIETERLFIDMVKKELKRRKKDGEYQGNFSAQPHFCGYEGRSCLPSNFDCQYCYSLGYVAALLVQSGVTGYMSCVKELTRPVSEWEIAGIPLTSMMTLEERHGKPKPVIQKALVDLKGKPYQQLKKALQIWNQKDEYICPGPLQFFGSTELTEMIPITLSLEKNNPEANT